MMMKTSFWPIYLQRLYYLVDRKSHKLAAVVCHDDFSRPLKQCITAANTTAFLLFKISRPIQQATTAVAAAARHWLIVDRRQDHFKLLIKMA